MSIFFSDKSIDLLMFFSELKLWGSQMRVKWLRMNIKQPLYWWRHDRHLWLTALTLSWVGNRCSFVCPMVCKAKQSESLVENSHAGSSLHAAWIKGSDSSHRVCNSSEHWCAVYLHKHRHFLVRPLPNAHLEGSDDKIRLREHSTSQRRPRRRASFKQLRCKRV